MKIQGLLLGDTVSRLSGMLTVMLALCCYLVSAPVEANDDLVQRAGLTSMWQTQIQVDSTIDHVAEVHLHVHDDRAVSYYEIRYGGVRETVSLDDLNPRGIRFRDVDPDNPGFGALQWVELRKSILEAEGKTDVTVELITVPRTTLYALTGNGGIHAIDAETGQTRWKTHVGVPFEPTIGLAANNNRVVAVRGSRVYCLNASNGDEIWSRFARFAPGGGVAISDHFAYVTSIDGRLQMLPLNETGVPQNTFASSGAATFDPVVTASTVSWATEKGYFNVARSDAVILRYRLKTQDEFRSPGTSVGEYLIANSTTGMVYGLVEDRGTVAWEFATGERLDRKPIAIGRDTVLIISAADNLIALDVNRGTIVDGWPKRVTGIREYVGASQNVLYFVDNTGRLVGLRRDSGTMTYAVAMGANRTIIPNGITDRLYFTQPSGALMCLREFANVNPHVHSENFAIGSNAEEATQGKDPAGQPAGVDPFGGQQDPGKTEAVDPFSGDDPFQTGKPGNKAGEPPAKDDDDDPFNNG